MLLKTPKFWLKRNIISYLLLPLSLLYFLGFSLAKIFNKPQKLPLTKICIGNIIAGGSGKTPTAIALGKILTELNIDFAYLTRGYGRKNKDFALIQKSENNNNKNYRFAKQFGDEALLLAKISNTFISSDRVQGIKKIAQNSAHKIIITDDGFQDNRIINDLNILVVDGKIGFGNGFLMPAGALRQSINSGLKKADLIILIGEVEKEFYDFITKSAKKFDVKIIKAELKALNLKDFSKQKLLAFCGIAYPQKFFSFLRANNLNIVDSKAFYDHKIYSVSDLKHLFKAAQKQNATLITTKKDWVKLPKGWQNKISYLDVEIEFSDKSVIKNKLKNLKID